MPAPKQSKAANWKEFEFADSSLLNGVATPKGSQKADLLLLHNVL